MRIKLRKRVKKNATIKLFDADLKTCHASAHADALGFAGRPGTKITSLIPPLFISVDIRLGSWHLFDMR